MTTMKTTALALRLAALLGTTAFFAVSPVTVQIDGASALPQFALSAALASNGSDDNGGDDHGGDRGGDDHSGRGGGDDDDDDHSGRGRGGDDDDSDDDDSSDDDSSQSGGSAGGSGGVVKIEQSANGIEVTYSDGTREEIENGRYERKNSAGRTVEERPATQADINRLSSLF